MLIAELREILRFAQNDKILGYCDFTPASAIETLSSMNEFSPQQMATLERISAKEFNLVAFPLYANAVGVRKGSCAALLDPISNGGFRLFGEPCILLDGNLTVRITEKGKTWFVWKKQRVEATPERLAELAKFVDELKILIEPHQ